MNVSELYFPVRQSILHAIKFGEGKKLLLCFHGFGESARKYLVVAPALAYHYTVIAVDLPYHGETKWTNGDAFTREDLNAMVTKILQDENQDRFSLFGYSLGGKLVLTITETFALRIDEIILVAPDGVKNSAWYNVAVYPQWGQKLFRRFVERPQFVFSIARIFRSVGVINNRVFNFLKVQTDSHDKRKLIYDVWLTLKDFQIDLGEVKSLINTHRIRSFIFIGKYDQVITTKIGARFSDGLANCEYVILEKGHNLITESFNEPLRKSLNKIQC